MKALQLKTERLAIRRYRFGDEARVLALSSNPMITYAPSALRLSSLVMVFYPKNNASTSVLKELYFQFEKQQPTPINPTFTLVSLNNIAL